ncbi:MAG: hypothetical protein Kow0059_10080 [Candidatus Sumerlaeia bacterium]
MNRRDRIGPGRLFYFMTAVLTLFCLFSSAQSQEEPLPLKGWRICVDPGHGGIATKDSPTGGASGPTGLLERDVNLTVALFLRDMLQQAGAEVIMTRTTDRRMTPIGATYPQELHARCDVAEDGDAHFFIAVHHNAPGANADPSKINATAVFTFNNSAPESAAFERALAASIETRLKAALQIESRGVHQDNFHVLRENTRPSVLTEASFITNPDEERRLRDPAYCRREAEGIFLGILDFCRGRNPAATPKTKEFEARNRFSPGVHQDIYVPRLYSPVPDAKLTVLAPTSQTPPAPGSADLASQFTAYVNAPAGAEVHACWDGTVVLVNADGPPGEPCPFQRAVVIEHPHVIEGLNVYTLYGQLQKIIVTQGQSVSAQQPIGLAGNPASAGETLLFAVRVGANTPASSQNPALWVLHPENRTTGLIAGRVVDADGALMGGQLVLVRRGQPADGILFTTVTYPAWAPSARSWHENFVIPEVPPGQYQVVLKDKVFDVVVEPTKVAFVNTR